ncbi:MAG: PhnD/SsuA/transferrin family substrate-binding protein [Gammaproteobacteria bacterium]|nr:PhnD/SsuA/transferrin family substrate-binding protein [Gammaproteobacteria bacterium]
MKCFRKPGLTALAILFTVTGLGLAQTAMATPQYKFGIVPQSSGSKLAQLWTPILDYLREKSGLDLEFATTRNIPTFEKRLEENKYDFAYMNPYQYTEMHNKSGYNAFAKAKDKRLQGIIVVEKNSQYRDLKDLAGQELAFPANAFAATLVPIAYFKSLGISITPRYVASHDTVYRNVAKGRYPAGGGVMRTFNNTNKAVHDNLRILWTSGEYTSHAFAASPRVPADVVARLQQAMLNMDKDPQGQALLKSLRLKGIENGQDNDWNDVRKLNIEEN